MMEVVNGIINFYELNELKRCLISFQWKGGVQGLIQKWKI